MSVQAGILRFDGRPADCAFFAQLNQAIAEYSPDVGATHRDGLLAVSYRPFHTTLESRLEHQPHISATQKVITWDGRLDNREDLLSDFHHTSLSFQSDLAIATCSFERWGTDCFRRFVGDWAISVWDPTTKTLILATDYMAIRRLYYYIDSQQVVWCTHLAPLVLFLRRSFTLNRQYIVGYLASYPEAHLTPYKEIEGVPGGSFVTIRNGRAFSDRYWSLDSSRKIRYKTDAEYEEHFRHVFRQAVRRRLRSDSNVLAELSGGIDSSSIICVADDIIAKGEAETKRLDTISFYNPEEPSGDERPYFSRIEEARGRKGHHFDTSEFARVLSFNLNKFVALPRALEQDGGLKAGFIDLLNTQGYRVVLSGIGGDEFLGGIPNPYPQLADSLLSLHLIKLWHQLTAWSLSKKIPWIQLLSQTLATLVPIRLRAAITPRANVPAWINSTFGRNYKLPIGSVGLQRWSGFWERSRREYAMTLIIMRRQLAYFSPDSWAFEERRYPYLDQSLIEFLFAIPASQILRPGQRRSLMRRALSQVVPAEILWRRNKGGASRSIIAAFRCHWPELEAIFQSPLTMQIGCLNHTRFRERLQAATNGDASELMDIVKMVYLELWMRALAERGVYDFGISPQPATTLAKHAA